MISEFIYSWLKNIIVFFMIIILVDLIMPKGNMKRYIDFFIGLILIYMVLSPFLKLSLVDFRLNKSIFNEFSSYEEDSEDIIKDQTAKIEELYIKKLYSSIKSLVEDNIEYEVDNVKIDIEKGSDFGDIKRIDIMLIEKKSKDIRNDKINIEKIERVRSKKEKELKNSDIIFKKLRTIIADDLEISKDIIYIYMSTRGI